MEKYGTPQTKEEDGTTVKVAAAARRECCNKALALLLPNQSLTCSCGNKLEKV